MHVYFHIIYKHVHFWDMKNLFIKNFRFCVLKIIFWVSIYSILCQPQVCFTIMVFEIEPTRIAHYFSLCFSVTDLIVSIHRTIIQNQKNSQTSSSAEGKMSRLIVRKLWQSFTESDGNKSEEFKKKKTSPFIHKNLQKHIPN